MNVLPTTLKLIDHLDDKSQFRDYSFIGSMVQAILKCGTKEDADLLLEQYLKDPLDPKYTGLLAVFKRYGSSRYAEKLYNVLTRDNLLIEDADTEVLELLGYLRYEPAKKMLADHAFELVDTSYYYSKDAILGLLHFDLGEYESLIKEEIEKCYKKGLFSEFIPALVCKLHDRNAFLEPLYDLGSNYASTDCNGGIILGFSLCGEEGKKYFKKILFDPNWETYGGGTGSDHYTYLGMKNLGITFRELYEEIRAMTDKEQLAYSLKVLLAMLRKRIQDNGNDAERFSDIFLMMFRWKNENESDNIIDLCPYGEENREEAYTIEKLLKLKMTEEAILDNYKQ